MAFGPYWTLPAGRYEIVADLDIAEKDDNPAIFVEIVSNEAFRAARSISGVDAEAGPVPLQFEVHEDETPTGPLPLEVRLRALGAAVAMKSLLARRIGEVTQPGPWIRFPSQELNWLPFFRKGDGVTFRNGQFFKPVGARGVIALGPDFVVSAGDYRFRLRGENLAAADQPAASVLGLEIIADGRHVALAGLRIESEGAFERTFDLDRTLFAGREQAHIHLGFSSDAASGISLLALVATVDRRDPTLPSALVDFPMLAALTSRADVARKAGAIWLSPSDAGYVLYGPWWRLAEGAYRLTARFTTVPGAVDNPSCALFGIDASINGRYLAFAGVSGADLRTGSCEAVLEFTIDEATAKDASVQCEVRLESMGIGAALVESIGLHFTPQTDVPPVSLRDVRIINGDWLPFLKDGPASRREDRGVIAIGEQEDNVVHGPYWKLQAGLYLAIFEFAIDSSKAHDAAVGYVDVVDDGEVRAKSEINFSATIDGTLVLPFEVKDGRGSSVEIRVWTKGKTEFIVKAIRVEQA